MDKLTEIIKSTMLIAYDGKQKQGHITRLAEQLGLGKKSVSCALRGMKSEVSDANYELIRKTAIENGAIPYKMQKVRI